MIKKEINKVEENWIKLEGDGNSETNLDRRLPFDLRLGNFKLWELVRKKKSAKCILVGRNKLKQNLSDRDY